jgi:DNA-binding transcriptional MerR regulator
MPISQIKKYVELSVQGKETVMERRKIIQDQKEMLENKIRELSANIELLNKKLKYYDDIITAESKNS